MKQVIVLMFLCLTIFGCNTNKEGKFFDYDEIDYYFNNYDEEKLPELYNNQSKSELDALKEGVILGDVPESIHDLSFIDKLEKSDIRKA